MTEEVDKEWRALRSWFIKNRSDYLPLWCRFQQYRINPAHEQSQSTSSLKYMVLASNWRDPFSYFYEPERLNILIYEVLKYKTREVSSVLQKLSELLVEFKEWVKTRG